MINDGNIWKLWKLRKLWKRWKYIFWHLKCNIKPNWWTYLLKKIIIEKPHSLIVVFTSISARYQQTRIALSVHTFAILVLSSDNKEIQKNNNNPKVSLQKSISSTKIQLKNVNIFTHVFIRFNHDTVSVISAWELPLEVAPW